jgi:hypothetical protein
MGRFVKWRNTVTRILRGGILLAVFFIFLPRSQAQVIELACPAGSTSVQSLQTTDTTNGQIRQNYCVDKFGVITQNSGGSGISSVAVLPACATATGTIVSYLTANGVSYGDFYCGGLSGVIAQQPANPAQTVSPLSYGATWDAKYVTDAAWNNASTSITCPNSDCGFVSNIDNGAIEFGTFMLVNVGPSLCSGAGCGTVRMPQGTLTVVSANAATTSIASTAACAIGAANGCGFAWSQHDDTTAINNAASAAWNAGNTCKALEFPSGNAFFSGAILNVTSTAAGNPCGNNNGTGNQADATQVGALVYGQGAGVSTLIPLPTFTFPGSGPVVGGTAQAQYHDFGINGLGQSLSGTTHAVSLFQSIAQSPQCTGQTVFNMLFSNWGMLATNSKGFDFVEGCGDPMAWNIISEFFGATNCNIGVQTTVALMQGLACFGSSSTSLTVNFTASGLLTTQGCYFAGVLTSLSGTLVFTTGTGTGTWNSYGDTFNAQFDSGAQEITMFIGSNNSTIHFEGDALNVPVVTNNTSALIFWSGTNDTVTLRNSVLSASTNARLFNQNATGTLIDECGNKYTNGSLANAFNGSVINEYCSANNTQVTAAKLVLSANWGTSPTVTATSGGDAPIQFTITNGSAATGASPTVTYTFPIPYLVAPFSCTATQTGGTNAVGTFTSSALSTTGVTFTFSLTPTASSTEIVQVTCVTP